MPVLSRDALEDSPLADLHTLASEMGLDGFRRLRKADLVDAILERQGGEASASAEGGAADEDEDKPKRRGRRGGRGRSTRKADDDEDGGDDAVAESAGEPEADTEPEEKPKRARGGRSRKPLGGDDDIEMIVDGDDEEVVEEKPSRSRSRGGRGGRGRARDADGGGDDDSRGGRNRGGRGRGRDAEDEVSEEDAKVAEGTVELLGNGSGFLRVSPPEPSDDDVYISAAQIRRCELVSGDTVTGPVRPPRRSERYPSLIRIDTINGRSADEVAEGTPFDELPAALPGERLALGAEDATLKAIEWLTPLGRGSRATIVGGPRAGKTEALRRLASALAGQEDLDVTVVLAGVRPEEVGDWKAAGVEPATVLSFAASSDAQAQAIERVVETAKRVAARGGHAVVLVDSLTYVLPAAARKALAAARNIVDGGSLTIVATADAPVGGETTVIALDVGLTSTGRFPALDLVASGTLRPELLVGEAGADAIAQARAAALG
jgi:transcription termination factor Rho